MIHLCSKWALRTLQVVPCRSQVYKEEWPIVCSPRPTSMGLGAVNRSLYLSVVSASVGRAWEYRQWELTQEPDGASERLPRRSCLRSELPQMWWGKCQAEWNMIVSIQSWMYDLIPKAVWAFFFQCVPWGFVSLLPKHFWHERVRTTLGDWPHGSTNNYWWVSSTLSLIKQTRVHYLIWFSK